jgi:hypothetical protein
MHICVVPKWFSVQRSPYDYPSHRPQMARVLKSVEDRAFQIVQIAPCSAVQHFRHEGLEASRFGWPAHVATGVSAD